MKSSKKHSYWLSGLAIFAIIFGLLTIVSGGSALFKAEAQEAAGNYVGFVLGFNFMAGFAYVIAGVGLLSGKRWSIWLSFAIAAGSLLVLTAFGLHILTDGTYEMRTVAAMSFRTIIWFIISAVAYKNLNPINQQANKLTI